MTLIAGILSRNNQHLPNSACARLRQSISRNPADEVKVFEDHSSFFAKVDVGAFGGPGFIVDQSGALSLMAGEPLLANREAATVSNRQHDLAAVHDQCLKGNWDVLREADGTFCMVHYQLQTGALSLMADKLGIRPLYFWADRDVIV